MSDARKISPLVFPEDTTIPGKPIAAFQRWELASFDPVPETRPAVTAESSAAEFEQIRQQAYMDGQAAGYQAGYAAGMQQAQAETERLQALMGNLQTALNQFDEQLARSLLDLSLEIAKKMVAETLKIRPEIVLTIVNTAIGSLPHFNQNAHLILNPEDAELVRAQLGEHLAHAGWKIFTDPRIETGGCRVETAHSNIDATNQMRWQNIVESLGQNKSWLTT